MASQADDMAPERSRNGLARNLGERIGVRLHDGQSDRDVAFRDLFEARRRREAAPKDEIAEHQYVRFRQAFQASEGKIWHHHWTKGGAVALTRRRGSTRLHLYTPSNSPLSPQIASELIRGEALAEKIHEVLHGSPQRVALLNVYAAISSALASPQSQDAAGTYKAAFDEAEEHYRDAAPRLALTYYLFGALVGVFAVAILVALFAVVADYVFPRVIGVELRNMAVAESIGAAAAGALGASVSVMRRLSTGLFEEEYELGKLHLTMVGLCRPAIGAAFGLALFVALKAGVFAFVDTSPGFYVYAFIAFLGGFLETFAPTFLEESGAQLTANQAKGRRNKRKPR